MKRYILDAYVAYAGDHDEHATYDAEDDDDGEWVRFDDAMAEMNKAAKEIRATWRAARYAGSQLDVYEFGRECAQTYEKTCECGRKIEVSTQKDDCPEYYTEIHVRCVCGKSVAFKLPVN